MLSLNPELSFNQIDYQNVSTATETLKDAVTKGDLEVVRIALRNKADPNGGDGYWNFLHIACHNGNLDIVKELLDHKADIDIQSQSVNETPLHRACLFKLVAIVELLINRGANISLRNTNCYNSPLDYAISSNSLKCCEYLIKAGANVNERNPWTNSGPIVEACSVGNEEIVRLLLDNQADPTLERKNNPVHVAAEYPNILTLLLERYPALDTVKCYDDRYNETPLHKAANCGCVESVKILLKHGADLKAVTIRNDTPLEYAKKLKTLK